MTTLPCLLRLLTVGLAVLLAVAAAVAAQPPEEPTPTTPAELQARMQQLHKHYAPYLRSLPKPLDVRTRVDLSGTWRWKFEVEDFKSGPVPPAPDWYRVDLDDSTWETTTVPEWRFDQPEPFGTTPPPWVLGSPSRIAWYRRSFEAAPVPAGQRVFLTFKGVDWGAEVWLNGTFLGRHAAYWEGFRFDVTPYLQAKNVLAVRVLAGANLDEPVFGWSVLPCALAAQPRYVRDAAQSVLGQRGPIGWSSLLGFGIHREVLLETTGPACISRLLVRCDPEQGEARIRVETDAAAEKPYSVVVQIMPENFSGPAYSATRTARLEQGQDSLALVVSLPGARRWQPTDPCLYRCRVILREGDRTVDAQDVLFGCRSFRLVKAADASPTRPAGMFLLNGSPTYLRGTDVSPAFNAYWYWHQTDKLIDAVLMMKAAHCNATRVCEHIEFPEVRELLDRLGMMSEQDLVGLGYCSVPMSEMAQLSARLTLECYNNPGVVLLVTGGSETTFDPKEVVPAVLAADPERVFLPVSGNMDNWGTAYEGTPPDFPSLPPEAWNNIVNDFHDYQGWYFSGPLKFWTLTKLYPPGRLITVGEFGAEGLDSYATMQKYPTHLQPPARTANALAGNAQVKMGDPKLVEGFRGREPDTLEQYIEASQQYQADVLAEQATSFRLSPQRIGGYFWFHFVDGLPVEWPKSLVSFDLTPKSAYFALAQVNQSVVPLFQIGDEGKTLHVWVANDRDEALPGARVAWSLHSGGTIWLHGEQRLEVRPVAATPVATVDLTQIPPQAPAVTVTLTLTDAAGKLVSRYEREVYLPAWQPPHYAVQPPAQARVPLVPGTAAGDPRQVDWTRAVQLKDWRQVEGGPTRTVIEAYLAHDGQYLYVKLSQPLNGAQLHGEKDIWSGDDWELFFANQRGKPYRQIGVNPLGAFLDLPSDPALPPCGARVISDASKDRWTVLLALPLATLVPGGLKSGSLFYGNLYRQAGGGDTYREALAWSPNYTSSFHQPDRFAEFTLE